MGRNEDEGRELAKKFRSVYGYNRNDYEYSDWVTILLQFPMKNGIPTHLGGFLEFIENIDSNYHNLYDRIPPKNGFQEAVKIIWEHMKVISYPR